MHLADNNKIISIQNLEIPLKFAENIEYTVEFRVVPALNHQIILGMPFLYQVNPLID